MDSYVPLKEWVRKNLSPDNELYVAILSEPDTGSRIEVEWKLDAYYKVLSAKVARIRRG